MGEVVVAHKILPFDFSPCSSERDRTSSGLCSVETVCAVVLPNEPHFCSCCDCDANSSVKRFAKLMASDPHTVWCIPIGIGFEMRVWRGLDTILGGSDNSFGSSPCPKDRLKHTDSMKQLVKLTILKITVFGWTFFFCSSCGLSLSSSMRAGAASSSPL